MRIISWLYIIILCRSSEFDHARDPLDGDVALSFGTRKSKVPFVAFFMQLKAMGFIDMPTGVH